MTKLHEDLGDAVNVLVHAQARRGDAPPPDVPVAARHGLQALDLRGRHGAAGALWDVWSAKSKPALRRYLEAHLGEFRGDDGELLAPGRVSEKQKQSNGVQAAAPANPLYPATHAA